MRQPPLYMRRSTISGTRGKGRLPFQCVQHNQGKCSPLTCFIPYEHSLLTCHTKCVWFAMALALGPLNSGDATISTRPAVAGVKFIQILLQSPLQVQSFHRGTGDFLYQLVQRCQLYRWRHHSQQSGLDVRIFFISHLGSLPIKTKTKPLLP